MSFFLPHMGLLELPMKTQFYPSFPPERWWKAGNISISSPLPWDLANFLYVCTNALNASVALWTYAFPLRPCFCAWLIKTELLLWLPLPPLILIVFIHVRKGQWYRMFWGDSLWPTWLMNMDYSPFSIPMLSLSKWAPLAAFVSCRAVSTKPLLTP